MRLSSSFSAASLAGEVITCRGLTVAGYSVTGSATTPMINLSGTWNTTGTVEGLIKADITDTASEYSSVLMDFKVGGVSKFVVDKRGGCYTKGTTYLFDRLYVNSLINCAGVHLSVQAGAQIRFNGDYSESVHDVGLERTAAGKLKINNGSAAGYGALEVGTIFLVDGSLKTVTYGAADSGGSGYKLLRIPN